MFAFTYLSYTGTGILIAAIIAGFVMRFSPLGLVRAYGQTLWVARYSLLTIAAMLAIGTLTRYYIPGWTQRARLARRRIDWVGYRVKCPFRWAAEDHR